MVLISETKHKRVKGPGKGIPRFNPGKAPKKGKGIIKRQKTTKKKADTVPSFLPRNKEYINIADSERRYGQIERTKALGLTSAVIWGKEDISKNKLARKVIDEKVFEAHEFGKAKSWVDRRIRKEGRIVDKASRQQIIFRHIRLGWIEPDKKGSLFVEPEFKKFSEIVSFTNPSEARNSVQELNKEFRSAKTRKKKVRVFRVTDLAAKRARATSRRKNLSRKEKREFLEVANIYREAADKLQEKL